MRQVVTVTPSPTPPVPATLDLAEARRYAAAAPASNTVRGYTADWTHFAAWCAANDATPLPAAPQLVGAYLASLAHSHARASLLRRLAAISRRHADHGLVFWRSHPDIRDVFRGIVKLHGKPQVKASALLTQDILAMVGTCTDNLAGVRDAAMILVGMAACLRRSEIVAIQRDHLLINQNGLRIFIPRSKRDPSGVGQTVAVPRGMIECPVAALELWLDVSGTTAGPVFRGIDRGRIAATALSTEAVRLIVRGRALLAGISAPEGEIISPHGLRAGCITQMALNGVHVTRSMEHARQRSVAVHAGYQRMARLMVDSPAGQLGL